MSYELNRVVDTILELTHDDAKEASLLAQTLVSLDWQQLILTRKQEEVETRLRRMQSFLAWREEGGEFCDHCHVFRFSEGYSHGPMYGKVYSWPHSFDPDSPDEINRMQGTRLCQQCFYRAQNKAENRLYLDYRIRHPNMSDGFAPIWERKMTLCDECGRMFPNQASYRIRLSATKSDQHCCLHCVGHVIERQFIQCQECGKKTASFIKGFCYDCYSLSFSLGWQLSTHLERAKKANTPATLTLREWNETVTYFEKKCAYCQSRPFQVLEHFLPISHGGGTTVNNCVPACHTCNGKKSSIHPNDLGRVFPQHVLDRVKQYLQSDKQENSPRTLSGRELIVRGVA